MDQQAFFKYLRKTGRNEDVVERVIRLVDIFAGFLENNPNADLDTASPTELDSFINWVDQHRTDLPKHDEISPSARSYLWAIRYYYRFIEDEEMSRYAALQRESRIKRKPFLLKDFRGVDPAQIEILKSHKIANIRQMLKAGKNPQMRTELAKKTGLPEEDILELVHLSDLARIPGVKGIRARLYLDAGIVSISQFTTMQEDEILRITAQFVADSGFDGIPPLPAEVRHSIAKAKSLPRVVDYE